MLSDLKDIRNEAKSLFAEGLRGSGDDPFDSEDANNFCIDVRLQVHDGSWSIHSGDAQYDTDHRGYWGASSVCSDDTNRVLEETARGLIAEVEDHAAQ